MTCIVGVEHAGGVVVGGDSNYSDGSTQGLLAGAKVFRRGGYVFGVAGSARVADLLRYQLSLPPAPTVKVHRYLVTKVVPAIRATLKRGGRMLKDHGRTAAATGPRAATPATRR